MQITWEEAHQIAGEIIDELGQRGVKVILTGQEPIPDEVEYIASIIFDKDRQTWSDRYQEWVAW